MVAARTGAHVVIRLVAHLGAVLSLSTGTPGEPETFLGPSDDFAVLGVVVGAVRPLRAMRSEDASPPRASAFSDASPERHEAR